MPLTDGGWESRCTLLNNRPQVSAVLPDAITGNSQMKCRDPRKGWGRNQRLPTSTKTNGLPQQARDR